MLVQAPATLCSCIDPWFLPNHSIWKNPCAKDPEWNSLAAPAVTASTFFAGQEPRQSMARLAWRQRQGLLPPCDGSAKFPSPQVHGAALVTLPKVRHDFTSPADWSPIVAGNKNSRRRIRLRASPRRSIERSTGHRDPRAARRSAHRYLCHHHVGDAEAGRDSIKTFAAALSREGRPGGRPGLAALVARTRHAGRARGGYRPADSHIISRISAATGPLDRLFAGCRCIAVRGESSPAATRARVALTAVVGMSSTLCLNFT